jgi:hypothetical protein
MMANWSDRRFPNLSGVRVAIGRWSDMEKTRGLPSWPGALKDPPSIGRIHDRNRYRQAQTILRAGLGPYMTPSSWTVRGR